MAITTAKVHSNSDGGKFSFSFAPTVAIAALLFSPAGRAAEWQIVPTLDVRETYSDNVRLAPRGSEKSDFITDISPGIGIVGNGPGLKLKANYAFQQLGYANDSKGASSFHKLDAAASIDLVKDLFSIDGMAAINQQNINLLGTSATDNYLIDANRTTVRTATFSPYLHHNFRGIATSELRYTRTQVSTSSQTLSSSHIDALRLNIASDPSARQFGWSLHHDAQKTQQASANTIDSSSSGADARLMVTPQFYLTAGAGYDKFDYLATANASNPKGVYYSGGFSWQPTERTSLASSVGKRFYGTTFMLSSSMRSRYAVWHLSYDESVTTTPQQFALNTTSSTSDLLNQLFKSSIPDAGLRQQAVDRFILTTGLPVSLSHSTNYLTNQFFLQKALRASVAITGAKNTVLLSVFDTLRQPQSAPDSGVVLATPASFTTGDTRQAGASALWNWKFSGRTNANLSADYTRKKLNSTNVEERLKIYRVSLAHQFQPKLSGIIELKHAEQASDTAASNYQENAIAAFLSMKF
jgi:uncharacterized protein (PEP-CTERM system associated)